jgi:hypothetical protein
MKTLFEKFKTFCCKASLIRKSRANYRCVKCDKDCTMDYGYYIEANEPKKRINNEEGN